MKIFIYESDFSNGRPNFLDLVCAETSTDAEDIATQICRGISDSFPCDEWAAVKILGEPATEINSIRQDIDAALITGRLNK